MLELKRVTERMEVHGWKEEKRDVEVEVWLKQDSRHNVIRLFGHHSVWRWRKRVSCGYCYYPLGFFDRASNGWASAVPALRFEDDQMER